MKFSTYIQHMGFHRCPYDQSLFSHHQGSDIIMLLIYVDDILITGRSPSKIRSFIYHLSIAFHMNDLGDVHFFLGLQITQDELTITVTPTYYLCLIGSLQYLILTRPNIYAVNNICQFMQHP